MMRQGLEHPLVIEALEQDHIYCGECGRCLDNEDTYECRTHAILCEDCLKMLHKRYV